MDALLKKGLQSQQAERQELCLKPRAAATTTRLTPGRSGRASSPTVPRYTGGVGNASASSYDRVCSREKSGILSMKVGPGTGRRGAYDSCGLPPPSPPTNASRRAASLPPKTGKKKKKKKRSGNTIPSMTTMTRATMTVCTLSSVLSRRQGEAPAMTLTVAMTASIRRMTVTVDRLVADQKALLAANSTSLRRLTLPK